MDTDNGVVAGDGNFTNYGRTPFSKEFVDLAAEQGVNLRDSLRSRPCWHQLLVIGNGFDRACGLPSSYSEFREKRAASLFPTYEEIQNSGATSWGDFLAKEKLTAWDIVLDDEDGRRWVDVEKAIADYVMRGYRMERPEGETIYDVCDQLASICPPAGPTISSAIAKKDWDVIIASLKQERMDVKVASYIMNVVNDAWREVAVGERDDALMQLVEFLRSELLLLEERFKSSLAVCT